jgi:hypothetical protein
MKNTKWRKVLLRWLLSHSWIDQLSGSLPRLTLGGVRNQLSGSLPRFSLGGVRMIFEPFVGKQRGIHREQRRRGCRERPGGPCRQLVVRILVQAMGTVLMPSCTHSVSHAHMKSSAWQHETLTLFYCLLSPETA